jgi:DNA (cytosine-5)-methyltransferase 1
MGKYSCEKCAKNFSQKSHYEKHISSKNPCEIQTDKNKELIDEAIDKAIDDNNGLNKKLIFNNTESNITINITEQMDISKMSKNDLLEKCKEMGITKCSSKNKQQLIELIQSKQQIPNCELKPEVEPSNICNSQNMIISSDNTKPTYTFIEVCAGGGGLSAGLIKSGFTPILLNDNNNDCCKTLKHNHPDANVVCSSMDKIDYSQYINKVDLLTGGVPCQSFSQAGLRKGLDDPRGDLMIKFIEILNLIKPKIFMIENVKGLLTHDDGKTIKKIIDALNKNNLYNISYKCLDASKYDVPQKRERVFIVGVLKTITHSFEFPNESLTKKVLKDVLYNVPLSNGAKYNEEKIKLFKMIPQGGCWVNLPETLQKEYLGNSYFSGGGKRGILYRLSMEKPSLTLLCTPSQKQTERCHPLEERPLTMREYARIQTFDDSYEFIGSLNSQYKQIGNAVPVELAKYMGDSLLKLL